MMRPDGPCFNDKFMSESNIESILNNLRQSRPSSKEDAALAALDIAIEQLRIRNEEKLAMACPPPVE